MRVLPLSVNIYDFCVTNWGHAKCNAAPTRWGLLSRITCTGGT
jgi:hypothetical protein